MEKENEENIWKRIFLWRRKERRKKMRKMLGEKEKIFYEEKDVFS